MSPSLKFRRIILRYYPGLFLLPILLTIVTCERKKELEGNLLGVIQPHADSVLIAKADSLYKKAEEYAGKSRRDSALYYYKQALEIREKLKEDVKLVQNYHAIATVYLKDFKYDVADRYLEKAKIILEKTAVPISLQIQIYDGLSRAKMEMRDLPTAISLAQKTLSLILLNDPHNNLQRATIYKRLGNIFFYNKQYELATDYLTKAIQTTEDGHDKELARLYSDLALVNFEKKKYKQALHYFDVAIKHDLRWAGANSDAIAKLYVQKAFAHMQLNQEDSALFLLTQNLQIRKKVYGEKNVNTFGARYSLGQLFVHLNQFDSAARYYQQSLISLVKDFDNNNWAFNPKPLPEDMNTDLIMGLVGKAIALKKIAENDPDKIELLKISLKTFFLADSTFSVYRSNFFDDDPQLFQLEVGRVPYEQMLDAAFALYRQSKDPDYLEYSLLIMERSRGVLLQNDLNRAESYSQAGISDEFRQQERSLISGRQNILQQLSKTSDERNKDSLYSRLLSVNSRHQILLRDMEKVSPGYVSTKYKDEKIQMKTVIDLLRDKNSVLLEYLWGENNVYILMLSGSSMKIKIVPQTKEFKNDFNIVMEELAMEHSTIFRPDRFERFCKSSHSLFNYLIGDLLSDIKSEKSPLIISSDGPLSAFPFEVLLTNPVTTTTVNYHLPYLLFDYTISYMFSVNIWLKQEITPRSGNRLLAFGYTSNPNDTKDLSLPGTALEISSIQKVMNKKDNQYLLGPDASESNFKERVPNFNIVHMAIHGMADTSNVLESHLIFRSDKETTEDGRLYAHELYNLNLNKLDLAILSACESGIGKHQVGEGMMSMAHGFAYAGCPSMVISLWKIDDRTTAQIMGNFYQYMAKEENLDQALNNAKADYLKKANEFNSHPSYWAAFLQIGDNKPISKPWGLSKILIVAAAALIFLFGIIRFRSIYPSVKRKT